MQTLKFIARFLILLGAFFVIAFIVVLFTLGMALA